MAAGNLGAFVVSVVLLSLVAESAHAQEGIFGDLGVDDFENEGVCPDADADREECPPPTAIQNTCLVDADCPANYKCCSDGCELRCVLPNKTSTKKVCTVPVDLGFLIDASGSIGAANFLKILGFVAKIIDAFEISENGTHVGVIYYSNNATVAFDFNRFRGPNLNKKNIIDKINTISVTEGQTRIDLALKTAFEDLFSAKGGMRGDKPKIALVMTDGRQTKGPSAPDAVDLHVASRPLKDLGVQVYSLGIGKNYDIGELLDIASDDASVFRSSDVDELIGIVASITEQTCKGCTNPVDIHFALDSSVNVSPENFAMLQNFVKAVGYKFIISETGSHMSASVFSDDALLVFNLSKATGQEVFLEEVDLIPYQGGRQSNMDKALQLIASEVFTLRGFTRQKAPKVLVMVTASNCGQCKQPLVEAVKPLREAGVHVITIPVGRNTNIRELELASSYPSKDYVIPQNSFAELLNGVFIQRVSKMICSGKPGVCKEIFRPDNCPPLIQYNCEVDVDCPNGEKCCLSGCDKRCVLPLTACITPIDLALAFENIQSDQGAEGFERMKVFAANLLDHFKIKESGTHVSISTFADKPGVMSSFGASYKTENIAKKINSLTLSNSRVSNLGDFLEFANTQIFSLEGRARQASPRVLVVFTHGAYPADQEFKIREEARKLKGPGKDVQLIIVQTGGDGGDKRLLQGIVSEPASKKLLSVSSARDLSNHEQRTRVAEEICSTKTRTRSCVEEVFAPICSVRDNLCQSDFDCPGYQECASDGCRKRCVFCGERCSDRLDLLIAVDDSLRVGEAGFAKTKQFLKVLLEWFNIEQNGTNVALMTYSDSASIHLNFPVKGVSSVPQKLYDVQGLLDSVPFSGGKSARLDKALELASTQMFPAHGKGRKAKKAMVIITDGNTDASSKRLDVASWPLRGQKELVGNATYSAVSILAISIGDTINTEQLKNVVSSPVDDNVFLAANYDDLYNNVRELAKESCQYKPAEVAPPVEAVPGDPGPPGPKGDKGARGDLGNPGVDGQPGGSGPAGPKGRKGARGDPGPVGLPGGGAAGGLGEKGPDPLAGAVAAIEGEAVPGAGNIIYDMRKGPEGPPGVAGVTGKPGPAGDVGRTGKTGLPGAVGPQGPFGPPGDKGSAGKDGSPGPIGDVGAVGEPGVAGPPGTQGIPGNQGPFGFKGTRGAVGSAGDPGDPGVPGARGYAGEKGEQGAVGLPGFTGPDGPRGPVGPPGQRGLRGADGKLGEPGDTGPDGLKGQVGQRGPQGPKGQTGSPGLRGSKGGIGDVGQVGEPGYPGAQGPPGDDGANGVPGADGPIGPQGPEGSNGPPGARGEAGKPGAQGAPGPVGKKGETGEVGPRGLAGEKGNTGDMGFPGPVGQPGAPGKPGATGSQGPRGPRGPDGEQGLQGQAGDPGTVGRQGAKGNQGPDGDVGLVGEKGAAGAPGPTGEKGQIGESGTTGQPGFPGRDGKIGSQGANGKDGDPGPPGSRGVTGLPGQIGVAGAPGDAGPPGARGEPGANGQKGMRGEPGARGAVGLTGPLGAPGLQGELGPQGQAGSPGPQGPTGPRGAPGLPGEEGEAGRKGEAGTRGVPGRIGEQGANGAPGLPGQPGPQGAPGERGDVGADGASGEQGLPGQVGRVGLPGREGVAGPPGPPGDVGAKGKTGAQGAKGTRGQDGATGARGGDGLPGPVGQPGARGEPGADGLPGLDGNPGARGEQGKPGKPGLQGRVGEPGLRGPTGPPGPTGSKGVAGDRGEDGEPGPLGTLGEIGPIGAIGEVGERGMVGDVGAQGETGPQGMPGPQGPAGTQGPDGLPGPPGLPGKAGAKGPTGDAGNPGSQGSAGEPGLPGKDGVPGSNGVPGKMGSVGPEGPAGPQGPSGEQGPRGRPGRPGATGLIGIKGLPGRNGFDGVPGKRGPAGKEGLQGEAGTVGRDGRPGKPGVNGTAGIPGKFGDQGDAGDRGDTGVQGAVGDPGDRGDAGIPGEAGLDGERGSNGSPGLPGKRGENGDAGETGPSGATGADGRSGLKGYKGQMGVQGIRGSAGDPGEKGDLGFSGPDGLPGPQGLSGDAGPDGAVGKAGTSGPRGYPGQVGNEGPIGEPGEHGRPGLAGPAGPPGPAGPSGDMSGALAGNFWDYIGAGGLQKGPGYWYRKKRSTDDSAETDRVINKNYNTFKEYHQVLKKYDSLLRGTGDRRDPARTCKELFTWFPAKESGDYWIDPNEGSSFDSVLVFCNRTSMETCIYPRMPTIDKDDWFTGRDAYVWAYRELMAEKQGILYSADIYQLKMMKLLSERAHQNVTYHCKNSRALVKILSDHNVEMHAKSKPSLRPQVVLDECKTKDDNWHQAIFRVQTDDLDKLPIQDVAAYDVGGEGEQFGLEIGPVCFT